jgi:hypothetical protein
VQETGKPCTGIPRNSGGDVDQEQPGGELLKKPEKQEKSGKRSKAWLATESVGDTSWKPYAPYGMPSQVDNIKIDLVETEWGGVIWIGLALDRDKWRALVNEVILRII